MDKELFLRRCILLLEAYKKGWLGQTKMPEDVHPHFTGTDEKLAYFTLPMALNYQRNSYALWEAALKTWNDISTKDVFDVARSRVMPFETLQAKLLKHKLALQPTKHTQTWQRISQTIVENWGSISKLVLVSNNDFLIIQELVQKKHKKGFPYLSGPKIFHYWNFIMSTYGGITLLHRECIDIAPDTHITQCSVRLGVITGQEAETLSKDDISKRWRELLSGSGIAPIDLHPPLWFWSRNGFRYDVEE